MSLVHLTSNLGLLGFALSSVLYLLAVQNGRAQNWTGKGAFGLFIAATFCVSVALAAISREASLLDVSGILLTSAIGWLAVGGHLQFKLKLIGAFVAPLATLLLLVQFFVAPVRHAGTPASPPSVLVTVHVAMAIAGQAFAIIACAIAVLYLWQQNLLKKKLLDQLPQNLPAIDRLTFLLMASLWGGFIFITLGLLSGALVVQLTPPSAQNLDFKVIWAILVWLWYLAALLARNVFNRPTKRIAQMALGGFLLLAITYFGMGLPKGGL